MKDSIATNFKVGENAVYPGHGVGSITAIETKEIHGQKQEFYMITMIDTGMRIMVPKNNASSLGLRPIISEKEANEVIEILKEKTPNDEEQTWNRRYREYMEKIKTGSVFEIAEVLRNLYLLKMSKKSLSFGEREMLETARNLLWKELILAKDNQELKEEERIASIFNLDFVKKNDFTEKKEDIEKVERKENIKDL